LSCKFNQAGLSLPALSPNYRAVNQITVPTSLRIRSLTRLINIWICLQAAVELQNVLWAPQTGQWNL